MKQLISAIWLTAMFAVGCSNPVESVDNTTHTLPKVTGVQTHYTLDYYGANSVFRLEGKELPTEIYGYANDKAAVKFVPDSVVIESDSTRLVYVTVLTPPDTMLVTINLVCKFKWTPDSIYSYICIHPLTRTPNG